jgi:phosphoribosylglycinamide formyltransferase-1
MLNIHPSLLPDYQGLHTHARVIADRAAEHGCSVHFVTETLDDGPVVIQAEVSINQADTEDSLKDKIQAREHLIYPIAVKWFLAGRLQFSPEGATLDGTLLPARGLRLSHADAAEELDEDLEP